MEELHPQLILGESLGSIQALRVGGLPHLFVSPSLGAPPLLYKLKGVCRFSLGRWYMHHRFPVKEGDRQPLLFTPEVLSKYMKHWETAMEQVRKDKAAARACYEKALELDPRFDMALYNIGATWGYGKEKDYAKARELMQRDLFGDTYQEYEGTHFMEEEYVYSLLIPKLQEMLALQK